MLISKIKFFLIILISIFLLTSCNDRYPLTENLDTDLPLTEYPSTETPNTDYPFTEYPSTEYLDIECLDDEEIVNGSCIDSELIELSKDMNAVYIFDEEDNIVKEDVIDNIEVIVDYLLIRGITEDKEITYNVSIDNINYLNSYNNHVYLNIDHINSFDTVFHTLLGLYSTSANYGLIYGLASYISVDLSYIEEENRTDKSVISYFLMEEREDLMDLTFPTLDESYTSGYLLENVEDFAQHFARYIIENEGIKSFDELLNISDYNQFESEYNVRLNRYIRTNGFAYEIAMNEYPIFFDRNPLNYHVKWYTSRATWFLHESYGSRTETRLFGDFMFESYKSLKENIILFENEMTRIDNILKDSTVEYKDLKIYIEEVDNSYYNRGGHIFLRSVRSFSHEYIHYITYAYMDYDTRNDEWLREGVACFYSEDFYYQKKYYEYLILDARILNGSINKPENAVTMFGEIYDREIDFEKDRNELYDMYVYLSESYDDVFQKDRPFKHTFLYISLNNYFIETYGEETYKLAFSNRSIITDLTNKTWEEIVNDWEQYIKAKYE
ncbi:hypothetical protein HF295_04950 [Hujiaoplasma nucleasis]|uniref:Uncharacterized protein n=1 Tax=Hujiaoplasma nucleasis TaxID=2725268 RepID=A0A7L6N6U1_9MOLU|nr:hypothetical protein [Hujiaoplasma nucleasis]QLY40244.1 hypothetical protein HF295_04950 [Hujiaoplasma nucleasis]